MLHPLTGQPIDPATNPTEDPREDLTGGRIAVSDLLMATGTGLLIVFLGYLIVDSFPIALLVPGWQIALVTRLLSLSSLPLVGFACVHLAVILNPANPFHRRRLDIMRQWATAAAIGFLLLIPLQGFATWKSYSTAKSNERTLIQQARKRLAPVKQAIESATSIDDLEQKLSQIPSVGDGLTAEARSKPIEEVKKDIMANLERSENLYTQRVATATGPGMIWAALQSGAKTVVVSIGFFIAFAAGAQPGKSSLTLAEILSRRWQSLFGRQRRHPGRP